MFSIWKSCTDIQNSNWRIIKTKRKFSDKIMIDSMTLQGPELKWGPLHPKILERSVQSLFRPVPSLRITHTWSSLFYPFPPLTAGSWLCKGSHATDMQEYCLYSLHLWKSITLIISQSISYLKITDFCKSLIESIFYNLKYGHLLHTMTIKIWYKTQVLS